MKTKTTKIVIIGGGAAGFFFAANVADLHPDRKLDITILEMSKKLLSKVLVSGGGRCNVTHACYDASELVDYYPRGKKELLGPFYHFGPLQLVSWFEERGVTLKTEADGRMFPVTNSSATIANCLKNAALEAGTKIVNSFKVTDIQVIKHDNKITSFILKNKNDETIEADKLFVGTGSSASMWQALERLGHRVQSPVPSLFTFRVADNRIKDLAGIAVPAAVKIKIDNKQILENDGPLLITHWGFSGPAILKLSAWGARLLYDKKYKFKLIIDWLPETSEQDIKNWRQKAAKTQLGNHQLIGLPKRLWHRLLFSVRLKAEKRWSEISKAETNQIIDLVKKSEWSVDGKSTFKSEFVTAGGVDLKQINFTNFESKVIPNMYLAGEVLNIDAITGGFNFQAAWTGAYLAAEGLFD